MIIYRVDARLKSQSVAELFKRPGHARPAEDLEQIRRMISGSNLTVSAWKGPRLIGLARALTDYSFDCYLSDLAVEKAFQRQGIGTELVRLLRERLPEEVALLTAAPPETAGYLAKLGFERGEQGWSLSRRL